VEVAQDPSYDIGVGDERQHGQRDRLAVIETFAELNLPIATIEKQSGLIATDWISFGYSGEDCDCGSPGLATDSERTGKFNVFVREKDGAVEIKVNTTFQVSRKFMDTVSRVPCCSTGELEKKIKTLVSQRI
jgi:hypothetical protein